MIVRQKGLQIVLSNFLPKGGLGQLSDAALKTSPNVFNFQGSAVAQSVFRAPAQCISTLSAAPASSPSIWAQIRNLSQIYKQLSKARLSALVVSTAAAGFVAGSGEKIDWGGLGWTALGTMAAASSANAFNQVYEIANDSLMKRTMRRPLPLGRISRKHAIIFAGVVGAAGIGILAVKANSLTAGLGLANIGLYAAVYTPLKQFSMVNTWVGAVVGAIPPLMGWAAASGHLDLSAYVLAGALYFWQLPHFMALAWMCRDDYARGGYRMMSLADPTGRRTAACALRNCLYLMPVSGVAVLLGVTAPAFGVEGAIMSGAMALAAVAFYQSPTRGAARTLFRASLVFLPVYMGALLFHRIPHDANAAPERLVARLRGSWADAFAPRPVRSPAAAGAVMQESASDRMAGALRAVSVAPFPFLPLPSQLRCPSKAVCEPEETPEAEDAPEVEAGEEDQEMGKGGPKEAPVLGK